MSPPHSRKKTSSPPLWEGFAQVLPLDDAPRAFLGDVPTGASALLALALAKRDGTALAVLPTPHHLDAFLADCETLCKAESESPKFQKSESPKVLPFRLRESDDDAAESPSILGARFDAAAALCRRKSEVRSPESKVQAPLLVATSVQALMQAAPDVRAMEAATLRLAVGDLFEPSEIALRLEETGHERVADVTDRRQYAVRGGILDVWPVNSAHPFRLEGDGEQLESIRIFDPGTQRSNGQAEALSVPPVRLPEPDADASGKPPKPITLPSLLPDGTVVLWLDGPSLEAHAATFLEGRRIAATLRLETQIKAIGRNPGLRQWITGPNIAGDTPLSPGRKRINLPIRPIDGAVPPDIRDPDVLARLRHDLLGVTLRRAVAEDLSVEIWLDTEGTCEHLTAELNAFRERAAVQPPRIAPLSSGFEIPPIRMLVLAQSDIYGHSKHLVNRRIIPITEIEAAGERLVSIENISPGDLVVHVEHGIGRFLGTTEIEVAGRRQEVLSIEYDGGRLHVPVSQSHLLARYVGAASGTPVRLHRLDGRRWSAERGAAEDAVRDLAASMLETQARRAHLEGTAFSLDVPWLSEFEATFPYAETADQTRCIAEVKRDMASPHPMDRLVCGDAGYGKTEVAMRAAFLAAIQGKQVAVLVPTTVLAQQHFDTFRERMGPYPLRIALHCRFCSQAARAEALRGAADGSVDILIGTHGLLQPGVRFKDLGLVVIDEEQRFGVAHKERLKRLRSLVDVLTLSATPIPRTLQLGLTGIRDLSLLQTPPRERVLTETRVIRNTDDAVRTAIQRELDRGGQVFYLHNRILTIEIVHRRLQTLLPHARIGVGHGQMPASQIEDIMRRFSDGEFDVLLSTTIVENGVDIPRANTILIDRADRFGIADLYQLRGRVGRGSRKGYAYLLVPPTGSIDADSRERLQALREHGGAGSGFQLALRDLGIRGAGNLLGAAQSGHISAVGFTLYCQLLRRSVARLKGEKPPPIVDAEIDLDAIDASPGSTSTDTAASLPYSYIEDDPHRIAAYRRLAECVSEEEVDALAKDLADRFGPLPTPAARALRIARLRIRLSALRIPRVEVRSGLLKICFRDGSLYRVHGALPELPPKPALQLFMIETIVRRLTRKMQAGGKG